MEARDHHDEETLPQTSGGHRPPPPPGDAPPQGSKGGKGPDTAQVLVTMAEETYRFIRADDGRTYGVPKDGPNIAVPLGSKGEGGVRAKLSTSLWRRSGQVASGAALSDCVNVLEGGAGEKDPEPSRHPSHVQRDSPPSARARTQSLTGCPHAPESTTDRSMHRR